MARALAAEPGELAAGDVNLAPGRGVTARVEGRELCIGDPEWVGLLLEAEADGRRIGVAVDGAPAAAVLLGETWREGLHEVFDELRVLGVGAEILTGDAASSTVTFPGVPWRGGLRPEEKRARVEALRGEGRATLFVGDGINDAAALAVADCAIAMGGGAALAQAAAPAVYLGADLRFLPEAIRQARRVRAGVAANLRFAAGYNTLGMAVAAAGWLHPVAAALLMLGSSAFVSVRAMRGAGGGTNQISVS